MHNTERWLAVPGFEGSYEVSGCGRVRGLDRLDSTGRPVRGRLLKPVPSSKQRGYRNVRLSNGSTRSIAVHRLVAAAFIGECPAGHEVNHINGIKSDNRSSNLEYMTRRENVLHAHRVTKKTFGFQPGNLPRNRKLQACEAQEIRRLERCGVSQLLLSKMFRISKRNVSGIVTRAIWRRPEAQLERGKAARA